MLKAKGDYLTESAVAQMKAVYKVWERNPRKDLEKMIDDCSNNIEQIENKISEKLDRSFKAIELLKAYFKHSQVTFQIEPHLVRLSIETNLEIRIKNDVKKETKTKELDEYSQIIARCRMFNINAGN